MPMQADTFWGVVKGLQRPNNSTMCLKPMTSLALNLYIEKFLVSCPHVGDELSFPDCFLIPYFRILLTRNC